MNKGKWTYTKAVLEGDATDGQGREELGDLLAIGLGVSCRTGRRVVVVIVDGIDCRYESLMCRDLYLYTFQNRHRNQ
jgi:hypothetical protein